RWNRSGPHTLRWTHDEMRSPRSRQASGSGIRIGNSCTANRVIGTARHLMERPRDGGSHTIRILLAGQFVGSRNPTRKRGGLQISATVVFGGEALVRIPGPRDRQVAHGRTGAFTTHQRSAAFRGGTVDVVPVLIEEKADRLVLE